MKETGSFLPCLWSLGKKEKKGFLLPLFILHGANEKLVSSLSCGALAVDTSCTSPAHKRESILFLHAELGGGLDSLPSFL